MMNDQLNPHDFMKPLHVPANFDPAAPIEEQVVFALAYLGEASAKQVARKLTELSSVKTVEHYEADSNRILSALFESGRINRVEHSGEHRYNLNKEVTPHTGNIDPDKLDKI